MVNDVKFPVLPDGMWWEVARLTKNDILFAEEKNISFYETDLLLVKIMKNHRVKAVNREKWWSRGVVSYVDTPAATFVFPVFRDSFSKIRVTDERELMKKAVETSARCAMDKYHEKYPPVYTGPDGSYLMGTYGKD